jgi:superfamily II DNA/RNA helicase
MSIYNYNLAKELTDVLKAKFGFEEFYPIQGKVLKPALDGRDIIAKSRTGTGKTLVLPLVQRLIDNGVRPRRNRCQVIVMEPTRELAKQVASEIEKLTDRFSVGTAYGGASYQEQERMLSAGVDFLIATPGRLLDFLERGTLSLAETKVVVLDESDEMLRRGFQEDIEKIFQACPDRTQTMLFSATLPPWVKSVSKQYLKEPLLVDTVGSTSATQTSLTVSHKAISGPADALERAALIGSLIKTHTATPNGRVIVFCEKKSDVDALCNGAALGIRKSFNHIHILHTYAHTSNRGLMMISLLIIIFRG